MNCVHYGDPLPGLWHIGQDESLPQLTVGSLVTAKKASGVSDPGERAVVYETYELGKRPGWSVIFQSGRRDGFSPCDTDFFLDASGDFCEKLSGYTFENVIRLVDHFGRGDFAPALGSQGHRSILERWFYIRQSDRNAST